MSNDSSVVAELQARVAELEARLAALEPINGAQSGEIGTVHVGGKTVRLKPLTPAQWVHALHELPAFLFAYAARETKGVEPDEELLSKLVTMARQWVVACAMDSCAPELLTVPEAMNVLREVSRQNGLDAQLAEFFRHRLGNDVRPGSAAVRVQT